jgi:hypothetical protein
MFIFENKLVSTLKQYALSIIHLMPHTHIRDGLKSDHVTFIVKVVDPGITSVSCPGSLGQQLGSVGWENNIL